MKKCFMLLGFLLLTQAALANVGFDCPKQGLKISRELLNDQMTLVVRYNDGKVDHNPNLVLPQASTTDAYQERYGNYYIIMEQAHLSFPYMPEGMLVFHMTRSSALFKKGFKAFEGMGETVGLSKLYCKVFLEGMFKY
jgi:hypothetical protein